jgi:hypothetical protein
MSLGLLGTIRSDGSPRISPVQPSVVDGDLYLGMMWRSRKALDLLRDPRIVLRNAICTNTGSERELTLRGRAHEVRGPEARTRFVGAVSATTAWREPNFHLFAVDILSASLVEYGGGEQAVKLWPQRTEFRRRYE